MHYLSYVYSVTKSLHVSGLLVAHHQEVTMYIYKFLDNRHMKVVMSALSTGRLYPQGDTIRYSFMLQTVVRPGLSQWIEPATFRLVALCPNKRHHRMHRVKNAQSITIRSQNCIGVILCYSPVTIKSYTCCSAHIPMVRPQGKAVRGPSPVARGKGKVHPRTGHEGSQGE
jgi:hypothetical protein